jgi:5-methylcytosine-specific restriction endonuclease McrA
VARGAARILDPETFAAHDLRSWDDVSRARERFEDGIIRSARLALAPPELILLTGYEGRAVQSVVFSRRSLFKRDRNTCQYCGRQPGPSELTIDHVQPKSRGGISSWSNCVLACVDCNRFKGSRTPGEAGMTLRQAPRKPSWKALAVLPRAARRESWSAFLSRAYWDVELEA